LRGNRAATAGPGGTPGQELRRLRSGRIPVELAAGEMLCDRSRPGNLAADRSRGPVNSPAVAARPQRLPKTPRRMRDHIRSGSRTFVLPARCSASASSANDPRASADEVKAASHRCSEARSARIRPANASCSRSGSFVAAANASSRSLVIVSTFHDTDRWHDLSLHYRQRHQFSQLSHRGTALACIVSDSGLTMCVELGFPAWGVGGF
jgi:hypothetical protein